MKDLDLSENDIMASWPVISLWAMANRNNRMKSNK